MIKEKRGSIWIWLLIILIIIVLVIGIFLFLSGGDAGNTLSNIFNSGSGILQPPALPD